MQDKSILIARLREHIPALDLSSAVCAQLVKHGISVSAVPVSDADLDTGERNGVEELKQALAAQTSTVRFLEHAVVQLCHKLEQRDTEKRTVSAAGASGNPDAEGDRSGSTTGPQEETDAEDEGFEEPNHTQNEHSEGQASTAPPGSVCVSRRGPVWALDPNDPIPEAAESDDGNAEKEQTDTEAAEDVKMAEYADFPAVVVHNLPRGVDRNYVVCLVESLVPAEEHLLCRLKDADDHTTSAELVLVSDDAAQRAIDGLYGRLHEDRVLVAYRKPTAEEEAAAQPAPIFW